MAPTVEAQPKSESSLLGPVAFKQKLSTKGLSFQSLLEHIRRIFSQPDNRVDIDELWRVLDSYQSREDDWSKYAHYQARRYTRNLVDDHEKYNVVVMSWGLDTKSCIHDHSGSHCFMKILDGELMESRYAWPDESRCANPGDEQPKMDLISETRLKSNDVLYINDEVGLHRVVNPKADRTATSLHIYIPPIRTCQAFDERTGQARNCKMTFYSKHGNVIKESEQGCD